MAKRKNPRKAATERNPISGDTELTGKEYAKGIMRTDKSLTKPFFSLKKEEENIARKYPHIRANNELNRKLRARKRRRNTS